MKTKETEPRMSSTANSGRSRSFSLATAAAVLTLGLGIGANTAFFSLADATLLRPLKIANPERLAAVTSSSSYLDYQDYAKRSDLFTAAFATGGGSL